MNEMKIFLGALLITAGIAVTDAQVRSSGNAVRSPDRATQNVQGVRSSSGTTGGTRSAVTPRTQSVNVNPGNRNTASSSGNTIKNRTTAPTVSGRTIRGGNLSNTQVAPNRNTPSISGNGIRNNATSAGVSSGTVRSGTTGGVREADKVVRSGPNVSSAMTADPVRGGNVTGTPGGDVRIESRPRAENFDRSKVRYDGESARGPVYLDNSVSPRRVTYQNKNYYTHDGYYYTWYNNRYMRIAAPVGFMVPTLPYGYYSIYIGGTPYYYSHGTYYTWYNNYYQVVSPPVGALIWGLPWDYQIMFINGRMYYEYFGTVYTKVYHYGYPAYQVVGYLY